MLNAFNEKITVTGRCPLLDHLFGQNVVAVDLFAVHRHQFSLYNNVIRVRYNSRNHKHAFTLDHFNILTVDGGNIVQHFDTDSNRLLRTDRFDHSHKGQARFVRLFHLAHKPQLNIVSLSNRYLLIGRECLR
uniref:Uncharacterized protein n=1 Tax=Cacopsylla melanoneura TaxID=428564 RepID=A0A8D8WPF4_9HEMI